MGFLNYLFGKRKIELPEGWTETEVSENVYSMHIPETQIDAWDNARRQKDCVVEMVPKEGFHIKSHGRSGMVYYVNNGSICEIYFELSGVERYDLLFWFDELDNWFYPEQKKLSTPEKEMIKTEFRIWLKTKKIRTDLFD